MGIEKLGKYGLMIIGGVMVVSFILPAVSGLVKPVLKGILKAGMLSYQRGREAFAEAKEGLEDLAAETREELKVSRIKPSLEHQESETV
jgi:hypothetical protein